MFAANSIKSRAYKIITTALAFALIASAVGLLAGFITYGIFSPRHVFLANILTGGFFAACGIHVIVIPSFSKKGILDDSTTYVEHSSNKRTMKYKKGYDFLFLGLTMGVIGAVIELLVWFLV